MNYRKVFVFWLPLAMSWLPMTFEGLWIQGGIGLGLHGILAACLGLCIGMAIELAYHYAAYRRGHAALRLHWQSAVAPSMGS